MFPEKVLEVRAQQRHLPEQREMQLKELPQSPKHQGQRAWIIKPPAILCNLELLHIHTFYSVQQS